MPKDIIPSGRTYISKFYSWSTFDFVEYFIYRKRLKNRFKYLVSWHSKKITQL